MKLDVQSCPHPTSSSVPSLDHDVLVNNPPEESFVEDGLLD